MARVYLASRYSRRLEMLGLAQRLGEAGHEVTSRWIHGLHDTLPEVRCAIDDLDDIRASDLLVLFTEKPEAGYMSGGRHVEYGYAIGCGVRTIVVGPKENVFHFLPGTVIVGGTGWMPVLVALLDDKSWRGVA